MQVQVAGSPNVQQPVVVNPPNVAQRLSWGALQSRKHVEDELDLVLETMRKFYEMEPDMATRMISAMSARVTEICVHLSRLESKREWAQVRTMQAEKVLAELDRQFKLASRLIEVRRQDLETLR